MRGRGGRGAGDDGATPGVGESLGALKPPDHCPPHSEIFFVSDVVLDLFGMAVCERRQGRGRPEHVWTMENSNKINLLFACGVDVKDVAAAIGITQPTLRKHYSSEVAGRRIAALRLKGKQLARLNAMAEEGIVTAERTLMMMVEREQMKNSSAAFADKAKPARKGLKEARRDAAWDAGKGDDDWGPLLHSESGKSLPN